MRPKFLIVPCVICRNAAPPLGLSAMHKHTQGHSRNLGGSRYPPSLPIRKFTSCVKQIRLISGTYFVYSPCKPNFEAYECQDQHNECETMSKRHAIHSMCSSLNQTFDWYVIPPSKCLMEHCIQTVLPIVFRFTRHTALWRSSK